MSLALNLAEFGVLIAVLAIAYFEARRRVRVELKYRQLLRGQKVVRYPPTWDITPESAPDTDTGTEFKTFWYRERRGTFVNIGYCVLIIGVLLIFRNSVS